MSNTPDPVDVQMGLAVRTRRRAVGLSQEALAEHCGVSFQQVQKYENGANRISCSRLLQIAKALGVTPSWFWLQIEGETAATPDADELAFFRSADGQAMARAAAAMPPRAMRALAGFVQAFAGGDLQAAH